MAWLAIEDLAVPTRNMNEMAARTRSALGVPFEAEGFPPGLTMQKMGALPPSLTTWLEGLRQRRVASDPALNPFVWR
jgi:hypothetical protein